MNAAPVVRDVVLVGGGHSHALVVRRWGMRPLAGVRLTLVSRDVLTPYSGMLPGLVAGHYTVHEVHIDLARLCVWANVRFVRAEVTGIDPARREIALDGRPAIGWDLLSLDTGSTPDLAVPGAREHAVPVKPVADFHARWRALAERLAAGGGREPGRAFALGVVGSGAGGFELVMAARHALAPDAAEVHWFLRGERPVAERRRAVGERALAAARREGVVVHTGFDVARVRPDGVEARDGRAVALDETLWCTAARAPEWPARAGLATDERGFVLTDRCLRSVSHPEIFASGDIGTQRDTPSAKAGVFAVRQAPVLFGNLCRALLGEPLERYAPQRDFLTLMATGGRSAIASRGGLVAEGRAMWRWKDRIDRRFMERFARLPPMRSRPPPPALADALLEGEADTGLGTAMRCRGCAAKVGERPLGETLAALAVARRADVLSGVAEAGDAAVLDPGGRLLVQSVDQLDAIVDDPWRFGRIAALHALSDVATVAARAHSAQVLATLPRAHERIVRRELEQLMRGALDALAGADCALVGGHTAEGDALALGLVVNALAEPGALASPADVPRAGDELVLTQALGIGTLFAAHARALARGVDVHAALAAMERSNLEAAETLRAHGARAITDVTGFGLLGHLERLLRDVAPRAIVEVERVPLLPGAFALAAAGVRSTLWPAARRTLERVDGASECPSAWRALLCDPQTGGGLLGVVPAGRGASSVAALRRAGYADAAVIGRLDARPRHALRPPPSRSPG